MVGIKKITQKKKYYEIIFSDENNEITLFLPLDIIIKYDLCYKEEITNEIFEFLKDESDFLESYQKIDKFLKNCQSSYELEKYIQREFKEKFHERIYTILESLNCFNDSIYIQNYLYTNLRKKLGRNYTYNELIKLRLDEKKIEEEIKVYDDSLLEEFITYHVKKAYLSYRGSKKAFYFKAYNILLKKFFTSNEISNYNHILLEYKNMIDEKKHLLNDFEKIVDKYYTLENELEKQNGFLHDLMLKGYEKDDILKLIKEY